jgi:hypothetical protein
VLRRVAQMLVLALAGAFAGALIACAPALAQSGLSPIAPINKPPRAVPKSSPEEVEFGAVDVHGNSQRQTITFENTFPKPVEEQIHSVEIVGKRAASFQIASDYCSGRTLRMSPESCTVEVSFAPGAPAEESATLELTMKGEEGEEGEEEPGEVVEVPLSGEGIVGTLTPSESPLSFSPIPYTGSGAHEEGGQNETEEIKISDESNATAEIESVGIAGPDASSYSIQWGDCEHDYFQSGNYCTMGIRFEPNALGANDAELVIESDASDSPLTIPLEGEGLHGPKIGLSSTQALLGEVALGSSAWHTFTLTNTGDYPLGVQQAILVSGTPLMFPVLSDTCSKQVVKPNASCAVTVGFQPTTPGEKDASILFITSTSMPLSVVGIDGIGVQPPVAPQPASPAPPLTASLPPATPSSQSPAGPGPAGQIPPPVLHPGGVAQQWLMLPRSARVLGGGDEQELETGAGVECPSAYEACEVESFVTAWIPARAGRPTASIGQTVLLGASTAQLQGGSSARVRIPLLGRAIDLLRNHGQVKATIGFVVRADGTTVAARTRAVTLTGLSASAARAARRR